MTKTQELKEHIYKHCPELKELSFGCEVEENGLKQKVIDYIHMDYDEDCSEVYTTEHRTLYQKKWRYKSSDTMKILGHPIHLEHVLRAYLKPKQRQISDYGYEMLTKEEVRVIQVIVEMYNLSQSFDKNCENQELVDFLLEVIK